MTKRAIGVLVSGRGSNMAALIEAAAHPDFPARIALVISNVATAGALDIAQAAGIPTLAIPHQNFASRADFDREVSRSLHRAKIEIVCLAGFMRLLSPEFTSEWQGRMLNIHPSLLPKFKGLHTHRRAIEAGETQHGCTVHLVTPDLDDGPILGQAHVPVLAGDTPDTLAARVLEAEHRLYPQVLKDFIRSMV